MKKIGFSVAIIGSIVMMLISTGCFMDGILDDSDDTESVKAIDIKAISGVTVPAGGETPVKTITETAQYTGTVTWSPSASTFAYETAYTATITLTAKSGYTMTGVAENFFTATGADTVFHAAGTGIVKAVFPATMAAPPVYSIGDIGPSGVGIVFYVTDGGLSGLEVAPIDQNEWDTWSNITTFVNGSTPLPTGIGTGSANTSAIIAQTGHTASAAQICRYYRATEEGDWFLPSKDELQAVWWNLVSDKSSDNEGRGKPHAGSLGDFNDTYYWTSSEDSDGAYVWVQHFNTGMPSESSKNSSLRVRAVRAF